MKNKDGSMSLNTSYSGGGKVLLNEAWAGGDGNRGIFSKLNNDMYL